MTAQESEQHDRLTAYLLGRLSESEQEALAEAYFADDEFFDRLCAVEAELLDRYVRRQLLPADREAFGRYLQCLPDGRQQLAVAAALMEHIDSLPEEQPVVEPERNRRTWMAAVAAFFQPEAPILRRALWIAIALFGGGLALLFFNQQLRHENERLQARIAAGADEHQSLRRQSETLNQQLAEERRRATQLQRELESVRQRVAPSPLPTFVLTAAARSTAMPDELTLPRNVDFIALTLPIDDRERYTAYRAFLLTTDKQLRWQQEWRQPRPKSFGRTVTLHIPARDLPADTYKLTLELTSPNEVIAPDYYFTIVRR